MKITDNAGKRKFISDWNRSVEPSVLWRCWLGGRKGNRPVKNWVVRCWRGYLSGARCRLAYAQLIPLALTVSCCSKIQIGFTFLVPAHLGSPGKRAVKRVCVCVESFCTGGRAGNRWEYTVKISTLQPRLARHDDDKHYLNSLSFVVSLSFIISLTLHYI